MGFAAFLVFLKGVGDALGAIKSIYEFIKNVEEFSSSPSDAARERYLATYAVIIESRRAMLAACANNLNEIRELDKRIFQSTLADKLGDADQAVQGLDNWRRSGSAVSLDLALDASAGALADMLQLESSGAYPRLALLFGHVQVLGTRLAVLVETDPAFGKSTVARQPVVAGVAFVRDCVAQLEQAVTEANEIEVVEWTTQGPRPPREGPRPEFYWVRVSYANASGTASFNTKMGPQEWTTPDITKALQRAEVAQIKGTADDRAAGRISDFAEAADQFERILRASELRIIEDTVGLSVSPVERARYAELRHGHDVVESLDLLLRNSDAVNADVLDFKTAAQTLGRVESLDEDERLLREVMQRFGRKAFLHLMIQDSPDDTSLSDRGSAPTSGIARTHPPSNR